MTTTTTTKCTTATASSHIQRYRDAATRDMHRMVRLLQTTEQSYLEKVFEKGIAFLHHYLQGDDDMVRTISTSRIYWGWWRHEWNSREAAMLDDAEMVGRLSVAIRRKAWLALHHPRALAHDLHPHSAVIAAGYDEMVQAIIAEQRKPSKIAKTNQ